MATFDIDGEKYFVNTDYAEILLTSDTKMYRCEHEIDPKRLERLRAALSNTLGLSIIVEIIGEVATIKTEHKLFGLCDYFILELVKVVPKESKITVRNTGPFMKYITKDMLGPCIKNRLELPSCEYIVGYVKELLQGTATFDFKKFIRPEDWDIYFNIKCVHIDNKDPVAPSAIVLDGIIFNAKISVAIKDPDAKTIIEQIAPSMTVGYIEYRNDKIYGSMIATLKKNPAFTAVESDLIIYKCSPEDYKKLGVVLHVDIPNGIYLHMKKESKTVNHCLIVEDKKLYIKLINNDKVSCISPWASILAKKEHNEVYTKL